MFDINFLSCLCGGFLFSNVKAAVVCGTSSLVFLFPLVRRERRREREREREKERERASEREREVY